VVGFEGFYEVSDHGHVRSVDRVVQYRDGRVRRYNGIVLTQSDREGRKQVTLSVGNETHCLLVHHLVLTAFTGPRPFGMKGCHNNGDGFDNGHANLRWDTQSENMLDKQLHGTDHQRNKERCPEQHLLKLPNLRKRDLADGHRACLACNRAQAARTRARNRGVPFDFKAAVAEHYARIMGETL
jgi:hypothetical protein